ncbi:MAG: hypothetical protein EON89_06035 [Brevundimonas sp.]|nr:MAG: hypothetical protein EON89_06035 [Brevundimonas sp.]
MYPTTDQSEKVLAAGTMCARVTVIVVLLTCLAGCATTRPTATSDRLSAALIVWPKTADVCDYERADRDDAVVISTSRQSLVGTKKSLDAGRTYIVAGAQLLRPLAEGEILCASAIRYRDIDDYDAVYGFQIVVGGSGRLSLTPAYARRRGPPSGTSDVSLSIAVSEDAGGEFRSPDLTKWSFDSVPAGRPVYVRSRAVSLTVPDGWIRRFSLAITEGNGAQISDEDLLRTFSEPGRWENLD